MNELIWSCPYCSLLCDQFLDTDVLVKNLNSTSFECDKAKDGLSKFTSSTNNSSQSIHNKKTVNSDLALLLASTMLKSSKNPILCGLGADVSGARSIVKLASKTNAIVDHKYSDSMSKTLRSLQTKGLFFTTLSEAKSRADLIVFVGKDVYKKKSCLNKKIINRKDFRNKKKFIDYGDNFDSPDELIVSLQNLSGYQKNKNFSSSSDYNKNFFGSCLNFSYITFIWDPACYPEDADSIADVLLEIIRDLNKKTRAGILTLSGEEGSITMQSVMTWMTGMPLGSAFTTTGIKHEPNKFSAKKIIQQNTSDLVVWISCFSSVLPDYFDDVKCPVIVFGHPEISKDLVKKNFVDFIFIPVATPGVDVEGHLIRCDGVVTVPLKKIIESNLPSLQEVISRILLINK